MSELNYDVNIIDFYRPTLNSSSEVLSSAAFDQKRLQQRWKMASKKSRFLGFLKNLKSPNLGFLFFG